VELKQIKELMAAMERTGTKRLLLKKEKEGFELQLERQENGSFRVTEPIELSDENPHKTDMALQRANLALSRGGEKSSALGTNKEHVDAAKEDTTSSFVTAPIVGTFYSSPSPDDPSFVKVGDKIDKNTVICIIEAMKVMNEVKAGVSGTVAEVFVENGHPVEFGSKLFRITVTPTAS
jgi:acetyl-CoA carboxylase biotin carboxyl carrier protein